MKALGRTPTQLVAELDKHIIGQSDAKRAIANALRNRARRILVAKEIADEIRPYNILMVGPTGVGKTEIVRRVANLISAPFIKVEATKFTQVGYAGKDVDSIIRDIVDIAVDQQKRISKDAAKANAAPAAENRVIEAIISSSIMDGTREQILPKLRSGALDNAIIKISVADQGGSLINTIDMPGMQMGVTNIADIMSKLSGTKPRKEISTTVGEAYKQVLDEECDAMIDEEKTVRTAIELVEKRSIVFIDEIDKIATDHKGDHAKGDVGHEGVQRDLLPLIEGTVVNTRYGPVCTHHILFITSGAFHISKPSDLMPELQGRLPIRVELKPLTTEDLKRILEEPEYSIIKQIQALLAVEDVTLNFAQSGIQRIAEIASFMNDNLHNTGARRLHNLIDKLTEDVSFIADTITGTSIDIDEKYVNDRLSSTMNADTDMKKFIL